MQNKAVKLCYLILEGGVTDGVSVDPDIVLSISVIQLRLQSLDYMKFLSCSILANVVLSVCVIRSLGVQSNWNLPSCHVSIFGYVNIPIEFLDLEDRILAVSRSVMIVCMI